MPQSDWSLYYGKRFSIKSFVQSIITHMELLVAILMRRPRKAIEIGCGSGSLSFFLSFFKVEVVALDFDFNVLKLAESILKRRVHLVLADAKHLPFKIKSFDVVFHQGLLEHYNDSDLRVLIDEQVRIGESVICSVPSNYYPNHDYGDERLLSAYEWSKLSRMNARYYYFDPSAFKNWLLSRWKLKPLHILIFSFSKRQTQPKSL